MTRSEPKDSIGHWQWNDAGSILCQVGGTLRASFINVPIRNIGAGPAFIPRGKIKLGQSKGSEGPTIRMESTHHVLPVGKSLRVQARVSPSATGYSELLQLAEGKSDLLLRVDYYGLAKQELSTELIITDEATKGATHVMQAFVEQHFD